MPTGSLIKLYKSIGSGLSGRVLRNLARHSRAKANQAGSAAFSGKLPQSITDRSRSPDHPTDPARLVNFPLKNPILEKSKFP